MAWRVEVDADKCNADEECVNVCPVGVFEMQEEKSVPVNEDECLGCESCIEVCPTAAITVTET
jgi:NAD-dependent dihydropyrimidine dehydrogenase PreA subunit